MSAALILLGHGARNPAWAAPFEEVARRVRAAQPGRHVGLAFLELMPPTLEQALQAAVDAGAQQVELLPLFLGGAGHVQRDLPAQLEPLLRRHPQLRLRLHPALGEQPAFLDALVALCLDLGEVVQ